MTEQSQHSGGAPATGTRDSSSPRDRELHSRLSHLQLQHRLNGRQPRLAVSIPKAISRLSCSKQLAVPVALWDQAEVPERHCRMIDDDASPPGWVKARDKVCDRLGSGFLFALLGPRGTGKTQIAVQAIMVATGVNWSSRYVRAMAFFLDIRATYSGDTAERDVIDTYRRPRLLVIDEMQVRGDTGWEDKQLDHLLDVRYGDMTDTILIGNQLEAAFRESMGPSISTRLDETGGIIECTWKSFRQDPHG